MNFIYFVAVLFHSAGQMKTNFSILPNESTILSETPHK